MYVFMYIYIHIYMNCLNDHVRKPINMQKYKKIYTFKHYCIFTRFVKIHFYIFRVFRLD